MDNNSKITLSKKTWLAIVLFGLFGQIAWAVENMYFNLFLFDAIGGSTRDIQNMVMISGIVATITTLIMGALSDKLNKRKVFICWGYIIWGIVTALFALISRENFATLLNKSVAQVLTITVITVIVLDCVMTFFGSTANDAAFNSWITDITDTTNRGKVEGVLSAMPLLALLLVAGVSGIIIDKLGYPFFFIALGLVVSISGIVGLFIIKDSRSGIKSKDSYFKNIFYGFKPSVIKENSSLYITLLAVCIFGISTNIFMPYLIIYLQHFLKMSAITYSLTLGIVIILAAIAGIILGRIIDKFGKSKLMFLSVAIFVVGLIIIYFVRNHIVFGVIGFVMLTGYILTMIILNVLIRDYTPRNKVGLFQGIRMIFFVLIPMIVGPLIGNFIIEFNAIKYPNNFFINEYNEQNLIPSPEIFLWAGIIGILIVLPIIFLHKKIKKENLTKTDNI